MQVWVVSSGRHTCDECARLCPYSVNEPTQYVIGLILDPCRDHPSDCCSDRFGEPVCVFRHALT